MTIVRAFLLAAGLFSIVAGLAFMIAPVAAVGMVGLIPSTPTAVIDVQGFYGGQLIGLGMATLLGVLRSRFVFPALVLLAASLGGTAFGRVYGIVVSGVCPPLIGGLLALEAATAAVALLLLRRARTPAI
jgi:hypothetical protein